LAPPAPCSASTAPARSIAQPLGGSLADRVGRRTVPAGSLNSSARVLGGLGAGLARVRLTVSVGTIRSSPTHTRAEAGGEQIAKAATERPL
jgi:MFS family permease